MKVSRVALGFKECKCAGSKHGTSSCHSSRWLRAASCCSANCGREVETQQVSDSVGCFVFVTTLAFYLLFCDIILSYWLLCDSPLLRQKAVCCLHYCLLRMPHLVPHAEAGLRSALCDPDPSVMWAAVRVYTDVIAMVRDYSSAL